MFLIKNCDMDNRDAAIYDNQVACANEGDNADPCTQISGGFIALQKGENELILN
jgi:hypothetical protein